MQHGDGPLDVGVGVGQQPPGGVAAEVAQRHPQVGVGHAARTRCAASPARPSCRSSAGPPRRATAARRHAHDGRGPGQQRRRAATRPRRSRAARPRRSPGRAPTSRPPPSCRRQQRPGDRHRERRAGGMRTLCHSRRRPRRNSEVGRLGGGRAGAAVSRSAVAVGRDRRGSARSMALRVCRERAPDSRSDWRPGRPPVYRPHAWSGRPRFEHNRYVGDKRNQVVYDLDDTDETSRRPSPS